MKKLIVLVALVSLAAVMPLRAAAEVGISGSLLTEAFARMDYDLNSDVPGDVGQLRQDAELDFTVKLADNVEAAIDLRANNMRINGTQNVMLVNQAYVKATEFLYNPLTVTIGKQKMHYSLRGDGNALWLGYDAANAGIVNGFGFDIVPVGFKFTLNYNQIVADIYYMKYLEAAARFGDADLYGFNLDYWLAEGSSNLVNFYFGMINDDGSNVLGVPIVGANNYVGIVGLGIDYFLLDKALELTGEVAIEFGSLDRYAADASLFAYAFDLAVRYDWKNVNFKPWAELSFALRSGEGDDNDKSNAWLPLMENNDKTLLAEGDDQLGLGNVNQEVDSGYTAIRLGGGAQFTEKISSYILFAVFMNMTNENTPVAVSPLGGLVNDNDKSMIGFEVDLGSEYKYSENLAFGLDLGIFAPGSATEVPGGASTDTAFGVLFTTKLSF